MSFIHLVYLGHFVHDHDFVRFHNTREEPIMRPVVSRPLDMRAVNRLLWGTEAGDAEHCTFPVGWNLWAEEGYLAFDRYALTPDAVEFITRLARATDCEFVDFNSRSIIRLEELGE